MLSTAVQEACNLPYLCWHPAKGRGRGQFGEEGGYARVEVGGLSLVWLVR